MTPSADESSTRATAIPPPSAAATATAITPAMPQRRWRPTSLERSTCPVPYTASVDGAVRQPAPALGAARHSVLALWLSPAGPALGGWFSGALYCLSSSSGSTGVFPRGRRSSFCCSTTSDGAASAAAVRLGARASAASTALSLSREVM